MPVDVGCFQVFSKFSESKHKVMLEDVDLKVPVNTLHLTTFPVATMNKKVFNADFCDIAFTFQSLLNKHNFQTNACYKESPY